MIQSSFFVFFFLLRRTVPLKVKKTMFTFYGIKSRMVIRKGKMFQKIKTENLSVITISVVFARYTDQPMKRHVQYILIILQRNLTYFIG